MKLEISDQLSLPPEAITETFGVLAVRGAGKSNLAAVMAEEMFEAKLPFVVVDPVGAWWGLRSAGDGKGPGLAVPIFGGRHGDVPLEKTGGQVLADLVVDERPSCVLDISELSEGDKTRFLIDFAERLYRRNQDPLHLFLEEADDYIPQRPFREQARLLRAWENIVRRGRARGLGMTMISQRSAAISKSVLTQIGTLFVLRTTSPQDRKAIQAWVEYQGQDRELLESLPGLGPGEAWAWSPSFLKVCKRVQIRRRWTFDSGATPKDVHGRRKPATLADVDLAAVRERMAATIERAKAEDPRELRKALAAAELRATAAERFLESMKRAAEKKSATVERVEVPVLKGKELARFEAAVASLQGAAERVQEVNRTVLEAFARVQGKGTAAPEGLQRHGGAAPAVASTAGPRPIPGNKITTLRTNRPAASVSGGSEGDLSGPERKILNALAWLETIGVDAPEQPAAAFLAGYTIGGGAWNNPKGRLRGRGLLEYRPGDRLALTAAGRKLAEPPAAPLTEDELQRMVLERLPGPEGKLLRVLIAHYPEAVPNEQLAQEAGYEVGGGAFNNPRGRLRTLGVATYPDRGIVRAADLLFPEGR